MADFFLTVIKRAVILALCNSFFRKNAVSGGKTWERVRNVDLFISWWQFFCFLCIKTVWNLICVSTKSWDEGKWKRALSIKTDTRVKYVLPLEPKIRDVCQFTPQCSQIWLKEPDRLSVCSDVCTAETQISETSKPVRSEKNSYTLIMSCFITHSTHTHTQSTVGDEHSFWLCSLQRKLVLRALKTNRTQLPWLFGVLSAYVQLLSLVVTSTRSYSPWTFSYIMQSFTNPLFQLFLWHIHWFISVQSCSLRSWDPCEDLPTVDETQGCFRDCKKSSSLSVALLPSSFRTVSHCGWHLHIRSERLRSSMETSLGRTQGWRSSCEFTVLDSICFVCLASNWHLELVSPASETHSSSRQTTLFHTDTHLCLITSHSLEEKFNHWDLLPFLLPFSCQFCGHLASVDAHCSSHNGCILL